MLLEALPTKRVNLVTCFVASKFAVRSAVFESDCQPAILAEILELLRSRTS